MKLNQLKAPQGAAKKSKRVGRGPGSGRGKTCGRGSKGLKSRSGASVRPGFEGGQMPLIRRIPKRGFRGGFKIIYQVVNLKDLAKFKKGESITPAALKESGLIKKADEPIKVLGDGELKKPFTIQAHSFSKKAKEKIEQIGGKAEVIKNA